MRSGAGDASRTVSGGLNTAPAVRIKPAQTGPVAANTIIRPSIAAENPPNVVIIFLDDSGWNDFHPFGKPSYPTPHVAQMAKEGTRFNQFYVPQAICSASRSAASLFTSSLWRCWSISAARTFSAPASASAAT